MSWRSHLLFNRVQPFSVLSCVKIYNARTEKLYTLWHCPADGPRVWVLGMMKAWLTAAWGLEQRVTGPVGQGEEAVAREGPEELTGRLNPGTSCRRRWWVFSTQSRQDLPPRECRNPGWVVQYAALSEEKHISTHICGLINGGQDACCICSACRGSC